MVNDLIRIGCAAIYDRTIAVGFELLAWHVFSRAQGSEELLFVPRAEQDIIAPLRVRVFDAILCQLWPLLDCRRARNVTKAAGMGAADCNIERPIRQAFINEIILREDRGCVPHAY